MSYQYEEHFIQCSQVKLHVMTLGNPEAQKAIVLLHGFPEFWYGWKKVADLLVDYNFYCIIPDQRGYNMSDKPNGVGAYKVDHLVEDVKDLITWTGRDRVFLAGHDWGAAVAWSFISSYPEKIEKLVIVNVPHTKIMERKLKSSFKQLRKSWYMFYFQLPVLPQLSLSLFNYKFLKKTLKGTAKRNTFTNKELQLYQKAWKGNVAKMLNWYRAALRRRSSIRYEIIENPVLILWGKRDAFLGSEMATESLEYCSNGDVIFFDKATHWVLHEFPEEVVKKLIAFF